MLDKLFLTHILWLLLIYPPTNKVAFGYPAINASLGDTVSVECKSTKATSLFWTNGNEKTILSKICENCNVRTETSEDANIGESRSLLIVTPRVDKDYDLYRCKGVTDNGVTTLNEVEIKEKVDVGTTTCAREYTRARLLKEPTPFCDEDGLYKPVQYKMEGNKYVYWCVNKETGVKLGNEDNDLYALSCTPTKMSVAISLGLLFGIQAGVMVFDIFLFFKFKEGIIAYVLNRRMKREFPKTTCNDDDDDDDDDD